MFEVELGFTTSKKFKIKAPDENFAEDEAIEQWKVMYPEDNVNSVVVLGVQEVDVESK